MLDDGLLEAIRNLGPFARLVRPAREPIKVVETYKMNGDVEGFFTKLGQIYDLKTVGIEVARRGPKGERTVYITRYIIF